ncbi:MAG TPA: hypothetical protein VGF97_17210 [Rhizomicrobium sp.]|jgi:hypothetical protein
MRSNLPLRVLTGLCAVLAPTLAQAADDQGGTQAPEHKITQSESYIMLEPLYVTVADADRPCGTLMVAIGLDIPDRDLRHNAESAMPILRDAYIRNLASFAWTRVRIWEQPDVNDIARRLQRVTDRALHHPGARVLLAEVATRITR